MPLHEYQCSQCGRFELIHKFSDPPLASCPTCGKPVQKLPSAPAIQFKGTGWYVTDYASKPSGGDGAPKTDQASSTSKDAPASKDASSSSPTTTTSKEGSASTGSSSSK